MKTCKKCEEDKSRDKFYRLVGSQYEDHWDCRDSYCKPCRSDYTREQSRERKKKAVEYLGGKCNRCGLITNHFEVYDFHHNDPNEKDIAIARTRKSFEVLKNELDKCSLYCANCHRIIHYSV